MYQKKTQLQVEALAYGTIDHPQGIDWCAADVLPVIDEKGTEVSFGSLFAKNVTTAVVFIRHFG